MFVSKMFNILQFLIFLYLTQTTQYMFSVLNIYLKYLSVTFLFLLKSLGENKYVFSNKLLINFNIKSTSPI